MMNVIAAPPATDAQKDAKKIIQRFEQGLFKTTWEFLSRTLTEKGLETLFMSSHTVEALDINLSKLEV
jgi:hypothetical protein